MPESDYPQEPTLCPRSQVCLTRVLQKNTSKVQQVSGVYFHIQGEMKDRVPKSAGFQGGQKSFPKMNGMRKAFGRRCLPSSEHKVSTRFPPLPVLSQRGCQGSSEDSWSSVTLPWTLRGTCEGTGYRRVPKSLGSLVRMAGTTSQLSD